MKRAIRIAWYALETIEYAVWLVPMEALIGLGWVWQRVSLLGADAINGTHKAYCRLHTWRWGA